MCTKMNKFELENRAKTIEICLKMTISNRLLWIFYAIWWNLNFFFKFYEQLLFDEMTRPIVFPTLFRFTFLFFPISNYRGLSSNRNDRFETYIIVIENVCEWETGKMANSIGPQQAALDAGQNPVRSTAQSPHLNSENRYFLGKNENNIEFSRKMSLLMKPR